jgi:hypothetical protein
VISQPGPGPLPRDDDQPGPLPCDQETDPGPLPRDDGSPRPDDSEPRQSCAAARVRYVICIGHNVRVGARSSAGPARFAVRLPAPVA